MSATSGLVRTMAIELYKSADGRIRMSQDANCYIVTRHGPDKKPEIVSTFANFWQGLTEARQLAGHVVFRADHGEGSR